MLEISGGPPTLNGTLSSPNIRETLKLSPGKSPEKTIDEKISEVIEPALQGDQTNQPPPDTTPTEPPPPTPK